MLRAPTSSTAEVATRSSSALCCDGLTTCEFPESSLHGAVPVHPTPSSREEHIVAGLNGERPEGDGSEVGPQDFVLDPAQCCYGLVVCPDEDEGGQA
ncbi:hypothetical protein IAT40_004215 [Kwoniella sp. CBS 6097]